MGRAKKWPPSVLFHKGTGQDRVRIDGRDVYLGPHDSEQARAAYARLVADVAAGRPPGRAAADVSAALTVADVVAEWWASEATRYSARGREASQFRAALAPLLRLHGPTPAVDFRADELESLRLAMATGSWMTKDERDAAHVVGWCANVVNRRIGRVRTIWRWAERKGHVPEGRWAHLCAVPPLAANDARVRHTSDRRACTWDELQLVVAGCVRPVKAMLLLQWWSGMRSAEVRLMRPCEIEQGETWLYRPRQHKSDWRGQSRIIVLGPQARLVLAPFLAEAAPGNYLFRPVLSRTRDHYLDTTYAQAVRRAALDAGVPGFHAYQARHACKDRITREMGLDFARSVLGQRSIETTNGYGTALDLRLAAEAAGRLG